MAASWEKDMLESGVPAAVAKLVCETHASGQLFLHVFRSDERLESYVKSVLVVAS